MILVIKRVFKQTIIHCWYKILWYKIHEILLSEGPLFVAFNFTCWSPAFGHFKFAYYFSIFVFLLFWFCDLLTIIFFTSLFGLSGFHIFQIGTVNCFDICFAWRMLQYIPIFHHIVQASIFNDDYFSIFSRVSAKYFKSCCGIVNDLREYNSVTVCFASVIFTIPFCPWIGLCLSVLLSSHSPRTIPMMLSKNL